MEKLLTMKNPKTISMTRLIDTQVRMACNICRGYVQSLIITPPSVISPPIYFPVSAFFQYLVEKNNYFLCYECCSKELHKFKNQCEISLSYKDRVLGMQSNLWVVLLEHLVQGYSSQNELLFDLNLCWKLIQPYACVLYKGNIEKPMTTLGTLKFGNTNGTYMKNYIYFIKKTKNIGIIPKLSIDANFINRIMNEDNVIFKKPIGCTSVLRRTRKKKQKPFLKKLSLGEVFRRKTFTQFDAVLETRKQIEKAKEFVVRTKDINAFYPVVPRVEVLFMDHSYKHFLKSMTHAKDLIRGEQERMKREVNNEHGYKQDDSENPITPENIDYAEQLIEYELNNMKVDVLGGTNLPLLPSTSSTIPGAVKYYEVGEKIVESEIKLMRQRNPYMDILCQKLLKQNFDNTPSTSSLSRGDTNTDTNKDEGNLSEEYDPENPYL